MPRWIITTEADARYAPLVDELIASIRASEVGRQAAIGLLDLGLAQEQRERYRAAGVKVRAAHWDYPVGHFAAPPPSYLKGITARTFLPRYFPGYDLHLHLDSDAWVQDWAAVELCLASAWEIGFAVVPEIDRCYIEITGTVSQSELAYRCMRDFFDETSSRRLQDRPMINSGVFAARADAPHWQMWRDFLAQIVAGGTDFKFFAEQAALHAAIWARKLPTAFLPAWCNWLCFRALPMCSDDGSVLTELQPPYRNLGIVHLAGGHMKNGLWPIQDRKGGTHLRSLRYGGDAGSGAPEVRVELPDDLNLGNVAWIDGRAERPERP